MNSLIKAPCDVVTAFPRDPIPVFNSPSSTSYLPSTSSSQIDFKCNTTSTSKSNQSPSTKTTSIGIQTETEKRDTQTDSQLTASWWSTEFAIAEFDQQNKNLSIQLNNLKVSLNCANRSQVNAKINAGRAESKLEISERVTSDLFEQKI